MQADEATGGELLAPAWAMRPLILAAIGLAAGLCVHLILGAGFRSHLSALEAAALTGVTLAAGLAGFTLERRLWWASIAFSVSVALVGALVVAWNGSPEDWSVGEGWRMVSLLLAVAIAAPLFQAARDEGARRFPYPVVHDHAWTNVVLFAACWVFVAIVFALAWLLAMLFDLIKIDFLKELLQKDWCWRALIGLAFGGALGLLREHDGVVRLLQRVVALVLAVLAPVLAFGLLLFVLALPFTGLTALWEATSATTPILLFCVVGALILANAVLGNAPAEERRFPLLRYGAMGLGAVMLPLAVLAAIAIGLRVGQYGFTPERLWAIVFVALACLWGAAYFGALVLGRLDWGTRVRPLNLILAFTVCGVALLLATPIVSFNAISTRDQLARLESGKVTPEQFDWRALAFDFGQPGRSALKKLQASANATIRARANEVARAEMRWDVKDTSRQTKQRSEVAANTRMLHPGAALPESLRDILAQRYDCVRDEKCAVLLIGQTEALVFNDACFAAPRPAPSSTPGPIKEQPASRGGCHGGTSYHLEHGKWEQGPTRRPATAAELRAIAEGYAAGKVEIRTVPRRQAYVGGVPVGDPFE
ncbi:DUF4153 domain-containing protein [Sphingomonas sp. DG1-23]|uniref:DUF4153 domain-containing protein n=1 Tax=Sphingomonas sp. DG1-23 TaxID=3068316 RepID=UPI00273EED17|nr:DUF4153 domain-containing protein [Sphingomonas sp. DG1-23]MDP5277878.1 DUF4153 domain-containing protein [Sphingomonas sp. DG1-23]